MVNKEENGIDYIKFLNKVRNLNLIDNTNYDEYYGYITIHKSELECLYDIYKEGMTFLDLGCGAGNVLRYANNIGYNVTGVDFNKELLKYANNYKTIECDLRDLDCNEYKKYDVIFSYRPLKGVEFNNYIKKVFNCMNKKSYLLTPDTINKLLIK